jgi:hypothetical protein
MQQLCSARKIAGAAALAVLTCLGAPAGHAQPQADAAAAVSACQRVPGRSARLDCYDRAFPPVDEADARQDAAARRETRAEQAREPSAEPKRDDRMAANRDESAAAKRDESPVAKRDESAVAKRDESAVAKRDESAVAKRDESAVAKRERRGSILDKSAPELVDHARIVEVQTPSVAETLLVAADGRVFVRTNSATVVRWPDAPFEVDIEKRLLGNSLYLVHPRTGERIRVGLRD